MEARPKFFYPSIVVAAVAVTLFSLIGIASMTGMLPLARSGDNEALAAAEKPLAIDTRDTSNSRDSRPAPVARQNPGMRVTCANCGKIEAIHAVERKGDASGLGAVAGGVAGALIGNQFGNGNGRTAMTIAGGAGGAYLGNKIEQNARGSMSYEIKVRMEDGSLRTLHQSEAPTFAVGQHVKIDNRAIVPSS